ncbi:hypothetical protein GCM10010885_06200 [Alicyclobacillus cellulosilyticus]|uniref:histidine kinase n=1 Tax=Alicyclobacillus cellulosilyticus TaxID=1003997 RepID=A0A917K3N8_9BACL|nr:ATP-binding protein [Alicyclobacillus cellulosilyticus]GGI99649.1 hypothetical protein GCM10010885_06200 [Alicyclobacillus cellulosilyticus]
MTARIRPEVVGGWERCRIWLRQTDQLALPRLNQADLGRICQRNFPLIRAARAHFNRLLKDMASWQGAVLLCDSECWLVDMMGAPAAVEALRQSGIETGVNVDERYLGNNGIGSAIATRQLAWWEGAEHYHRALHEWSTAGAPLISGSLIGAIAVAVPSPTLDPSLITLVQSAAVAILNWLEVEASREDTLRMHHSLLSQIEYHVVYLNAQGEMVQERHPLPISDRVRCAMHALTRQEEADHAELTLDDQVYQADIRCLYDSTGQLSGKIGVFRNVTQLKRLEARAQDAEKLSLLTSLTAGIAHEIRNPLTTARGFLQLFLKRLSSEEDKRFLELTIEELDRIHHLVTDFMSLARPNPPRFAHVDVAALLEAVAEFIQPEMSLHSVRFDVTPLPRGVWVWGDENQLKQVVLNIIQNALQACTQNDTIRLSARVHGQMVDIVVEDTGLGMDPDQVRRAFTPFYTTKASGTGLGLFICKRIVEAHQGKIDIDSAPGRGTRVTVRLQCTHKPEREPRNADATV